MSTVEEANWERDVIAFLKYLSDKCRNCFKRYNCENCDITTAKSLANRKEQIGISHKNLLDKIRDPYSLNARYHEIISILRKAGKPIRAREIVLRSTRSRNVKWWTLTRMVSKGLIRKTRVKNFYGRYEAAYYTQEKAQ